MTDELKAMQDIQTSQKKWRKTIQIIFVTIIFFSSILFIVFPMILPSMLMQFILLLSMASVFGLFFLDRISHQLNKKYFEQEIVHKYFFQHLRPEDLHKDADLVVELISKRRKDNKSIRSV